MLKRFISSITFGDVLKVASGFALGVAYFLSPIHDRVLYTIYGEGVKLEIENEEILDPDRGFAPAFTIAPTTSLGISSGVLTWKFDTSGETKISGSRIGSMDIEQFLHPKTFKLDSLIDLSASGHRGSLSISFSFSNKFAKYDLGTYNFNIFRQPHRRSVGKKNFTGTWVVHFLDYRGIGELSIIEDRNRTFSGTFTPAAGFTNVDSFNVRGVRDGQNIWFDVVESEANGIILENGIYEFDTEGNAVIKGTIIHCSPCGNKTRKEKVSSEVWMYAPYLK